MKMVLTLAGDSYEDKDQFKAIMNVGEYVCAISRALQEISYRIKHCEITDEEHLFLESLRQTLHIEE